MDISRFHGGPILAVTQPFMHLGARCLLVPSSVSAFSGVAGSVGMQIEDVIAGNKCSECWELWMGDGGWVGVGFLSHMGRVARGGSLGRFK